MLLKVVRDFEKVKFTSLTHKNVEFRSLIHTSNSSLFKRYKSLETAIYLCQGFVPAIFLIKYVSETQFQLQVNMIFVFLYLFPYFLISFIQTVDVPLFHF